MAQFILLIRGGNDLGLSPEEMQQRVARYSAWAQKLAQEGKLVSAFKLKDDGGRVLSRQNGSVQIDGPFAETKETIGGYFVIHADDYETAAGLAHGCPILEDENGSIELREIEL